MLRTTGKLGSSKGTQKLLRKKFYKTHGGPETEQVCMASPRAAKAVLAAMWAKIRSVYEEELHSALHRRGKLVG
jgi:hypothetical protein